MFLVVMIVVSLQLVGSFISNSLALMGDALHSATDGLAHLVSILAVSLGRIAQNRSFRSAGVKILGGMLILAGLHLASEGIERIFNPRSINAGLMIAFACIGMIGNFAQHWILSKVAREEQDALHRGLNRHVLGDLWTSIAVVFSGFIVLFTGWMDCDILLSFFVAAILIYWGAMTVFDSDGHNHHCHHSH